MNASFFLSKKFYIPAIVAVLVVAIGARSYQKSHEPPEYETTMVERGSLVQTVDGTGKVESVTDLSLRFDAVGTLSVVNVKEGSAVKTGDILATLRLAELNAAVAQASANLNQRLAGATEEDRAYYKAALDAAAASRDQAVVDAANSIRTAEGNVETARNNLKLAEGGDNSQIVTDAYENTVAVLQGARTKIDDALTQADNILGIDNTLANDGFETSLALLSQASLTRAKAEYALTKDAVVNFRASVAALNTQSPRTAIDAALPLAENALIKANQLLASVSEVLAATVPNASIPQATLDSKKTTIETTRAATASQLTTILNQKQAIVDARNSFSTYSIAYDKAVRDLDAARVNADSSVKIKQAAYEQALANYQSKINPPREVDVAAYRAALAQAVAARDKAIIRAPIDGVVTKVNKKVGETASSADTVIQLLTPHYEIKVDIPETDVSKLGVSNPVEVTLDAFGEDTKFAGSILAIDPGSTEVQDVVYYKVTIALADTDKPIKPGMTANVAIKTDSRENTLFVPSRTIRTRDNGGKYVRVLENGQEKEVDVKIGIRADGAETEILEGLSEGQTIIISVKEK